MRELRIKNLSSRFPLLLLDRIISLIASQSSVCAQIFTGRLGAHALEISPSPAEDAKDERRIKPAQVTLLKT